MCVCIVYCVLEFHFDMPQSKVALLSITKMWLKYLKFSTYYKFFYIFRNPRGHSCTVLLMKVETRKNWRALSTSVKIPSLRYSSFMSVGWSILISFKGNQLPVEYGILDLKPTSTGLCP